MINIDFEKFIKDRAWLGWYWTGSIFPKHDPYWCKICTPGKEWTTGVVITKWQSW